MAIRVAVVVDSRNVLGQVGATCGVRARPTVNGIRSALGRFGLDVAQVHIGLALARPQDEVALAPQHATNDAYRKSILADGGEVLLGELHIKPPGQVQEKIVDVACAVCATRYVEAIHRDQSDVDMIVMMSKDIDLTPALDYAIAMDVPILAAAADVVQHRPHPFLLLPPHALSEITGESRLKTGHDLRELLAVALHDQRPLTMTVAGPAGNRHLVLECGLRGVPADGVAIPAHGEQVDLYPVDVERRQTVADGFPVLVCGTSPAPSRWVFAKVLRRSAPMTVVVEFPDGHRKRVHYPLGGLVPGETVLVHRESGLAVGRLETGATRAFDPDAPLSVRVVTQLPKGGAIATTDDGTRGLLVTDQSPRPGAVLPAMQVDQKPRGPVWTAIGSPLSA